MITLRQALQTTPWRMLLFIGRRRGVSLSSKILKTHLVDKLAQALSDPANLQIALAQLSTSERQALADLQAAGGRVPLRHLRQRHGDLRPLRRAPGHYNPPQPATNASDLSPLEKLRALGLIFHHHPTDEIFIPTDLIPLLPVLSNIEGPAPDALRDEGGRLKDEKIIHPSAPLRIPHPSSFALDLLCHDLAYLLALLWRDDIAPLHGRWLPPLFLAEWGQNCAIPPAAPQAKSELQTGRRRFIHYLAESAGFLPPSALSLQPSPAAWLWLNASRADRLKTLWDAWLAPDPDRWRTFRLPGHDWLTDPAALLSASRLHSALTKIDPAVFAQTWLAQQPGLIELVPHTTLNPAEVLVETVIELLRGPLVWLGVLQNSPHPPPYGRLSQGERGAAQFPLPGGEGQGEGDFPGPPSSPRLTPQGRAWLTGQPLPDDAPVPPAKFAVQAKLQPNPLDSTLTLTLSGGLPDPADLVVAVEVARPQKGEGRREKGEEKQESPFSPLSSVYYFIPHPSSFVLTPSSFILCLHRGWSAPALLDALNRLAARPLSAAETALLCAWADAAEKMTLRHAVILETADPAILTRLASTRRGRALIHRTLSPRAVIIDPARLDQLTRRLMEQEGVPPRDEGRRMKDELIPPSSLIPHPSLWLAVQTYRRLGQHLRLPARIPQAVLDSLSAHLTSTDLAAADVAAEQIMAALRRALDGEMPFPAWNEPALPHEETLAVIERALAAGHNLDLEYYAASTDTITRRVVEPYRVEQRGDLAYLVGFCQHAQAERMFRLDRVRAIQMIKAE